MYHWFSQLLLASIVCNVISQLDFNSSELLSGQLDKVSHSSLIAPSQCFLDYFKNHFIENLSSLKNETDDSLKCEKKILSLLESMTNSDESALALKFLDALGKPPSGFLDGNTMFMGSYDTCHASDLLSNGYKPCKIKATLILKNKVVTPLTWTVCFPEECRGGNYTSLTQMILNLINKDSKMFHIPEDSIETSCAIDYQYTVGSYVAIVLVSVILFLVLVGTVWEPISVLALSLKFADDRKVLVNSEDIEPEAILPDNSPLGDQQYVKPMNRSSNSSVGNFLQCFSMTRTFAALFNTTTKEGQILSLNGIRVLSINWVVLGHVYYISTNAADLSNYVPMWRKNAMAIIYNALPTVDTFFFLSGLLVSLLLLKDLARTQGRFRAGGYYLHRYIRLTAPFLVVTVVQGFLAHIYIRGPFEDLLAHGHEACVKYWWTNMLYINNLVPWNKTEICVSQSWYLSNDFQFFLVAPLFIWLLHKNYRIGIPVTVVTLSLSCIAAGVITYFKKLGPTTVFDPTSDKFEDFRYLYDKPWIRCPPYLIGILGGWFCYKHMDSLRLYTGTLNLMPKLLVSSFLWGITCLIEYWVVFGLRRDMLKKTSGEELNLVESVLYETFARSAWAFALLIQVILCQCGLGGIINRILSWKGWIVLSRLTFSVYLLHYFIVQAFVVQLRHPFFYKPDFEAGVIYSGILLISYAAAVLLFTFVEQPVTFFEQLTYRK